MSENREVGMYAPVLADEGPMTAWELAHIPETAALDPEWALQIIGRLVETVRERDARIDAARDGLQQIHDAPQCGSFIARLAASSLRATERP